MRKKLIVANWKMHLNTIQASLLIHRLEERIRIHQEVELVLAPPMLTLQPLSLQIDRRKFRLAAQNAYFKDEGAYTGEVSFTMLRDLAHYVLVGQSERRRLFHEDLPMVRDKLAASFRNEITPILCIGETKQERDDGETKQVLHDQLMSAISNLTDGEVAQMVIAYEPVWAIGQGLVVAKPAEIKEVVDYVRSYISGVHGDKVAEVVRIIYGGDVMPEVVNGILDVDGIDGFLVGHASLNYDQFATIVNETQNWLTKGGIQ